MICTCGFTFHEVYHGAGRNLSHAPDCAYAKPRRSVRPDEAAAFDRALWASVRDVEDLPND